MENINEELGYMKYLFGYQKGVVISEQQVQPVGQEPKEYIDDPDLVAAKDNLSKLNALTKSENFKQTKLDNSNYEYSLKMMPNGRGLKLLQQKYIGDKPASTGAIDVKTFLFGAQGKTIVPKEFITPMYMKNTKDIEVARNYLSQVGANLDKFMAKFSPEAKMTVYAANTVLIGDPKPITGA